MARRARSGGRLRLAVLVAVVLAASLRAEPPGKAEVIGDPLRPGVLGRPLDPPDKPNENRALVLPVLQLDAPLGFTGPSGVLPRSGDNPEYQTVEDRWRIGFPYWDRYGAGFEGHEAAEPGSGASTFIRLATVGYALALAVSAFLLYVFGRFEDTQLAPAIHETVVLGLPATVGAAAARLILDT